MWTPIIEYFIAGPLTMLGDHFVMIRSKNDGLSVGHACCVDFAKSSLPTDAWRERTEVHQRQFHRHMAR